MADSRDQQKKTATSSSSAAVTFLVRESPLTLVRQSSGGQVLYSYILSLVSLLFVSESVHYVLDQELMWQDLAFLVRQFYRADVFFLTAICTHIPVFLILYPAARMSAQSPTARTMFIWIAISVIAIIAVIPTMIVSMIPGTGVLVRFGIGTEHVRLMLKVIAFATEIHRSATKQEEGQQLTASSQDSDISKKEIGFQDESIYSLESLSYFLFAPTLIYRSRRSYPGLGRKRDFSVIGKHVLDMLMLMYVAFYAYRRGYEPVMWRLGTVPYSQFSANYIVSVIFWSTIQGWMCLLGIGIGFLHSWLNVWAEAMDFGDRQFYRAWWRCTGINEFMRTWNYLIHSWISCYMYRPIRTLSGSKQLALLSVILGSALVHDYIMSLCVGFMFPEFQAVVLFVVVRTFLFADPANYLTRRTGGNFFTFFVLHVTAFVIVFMGADLITRTFNCHVPDKSRFSMIPGFLDCQW